MKRILLLHGFASSSGSHKAQFMRSKFSAIPQVEFQALDFNPSPEDFRSLTVSRMVEQVHDYLIPGPAMNTSLIGSSMGALVALHYAHRFGGIRRLLLLAPALTYRPQLLSPVEMELWSQAGAWPVWHFGFERELPLDYGFHLDGLGYLEPVPPAAPTTIFHGRRDETIPIALSRDYAATYPGLVGLIELESDHRLNDRLEEIWAHARRELMNDLESEAPADG